MIDVTVDGYNIEIEPDDVLVLREGSQFISAGIDDWVDFLLPAMQERIEFYNRYRELRDQYAAGHQELDNDFSWDSPFLLVESGSGRETYVSLFSTLEDAGDYCYSGEGDWHPDKVVDLRTGEEFFPSTSTVFRKREAT